MNACVCLYFKRLIYPIRNYIYFLLALVVSLTQFKLFPCSLESLILSSVFENQKEGLCDQIKVELFKTYVSIP